jgi:hypothetical protein
MEVPMARAAGLSGTPIYRRKIPFFFSTRGTTKNQGAPQPHQPQNLRIIRLSVVDSSGGEEKQKIGSLYRTSTSPKEAGGRCDAEAT